MRKLELSGILDGDDSLVGVNHGGDCVQQRGLASARAPAHHHVGALRHTIPDLTADIGTSEGLKGVRRKHEPSNGDVRPVEGDGGYDDIHPASIRQPAIDQRRPVIDPPANGSHDPFDQKIDLVAFKFQRVLNEPAMTLDPDGTGTIDHDLADFIVGKDLFKRAKARESGFDLSLRIHSLSRREQWRKTGDFLMNVDAFPPVEHKPVNLINELGKVFITEGAHRTERSS
jgi:hypothetical protein